MYQRNQWSLPSSNSMGSKAQLICALPTCSKKETEFQANLINSISPQFYIKYNVPILNWSTDGDSVRRQLSVSLMSHDLQQSSPIYEIISKLKLIDTKVGIHQETVNFNAKHLIKLKRVPTCMIKGFNLGDTYISKSDILTPLKSSKTYESTHSVKELVNPKDKQNVPLATEFVPEYMKAVSDIETVKKINFHFVKICDELQLFKYVIVQLCLP